jgi:hypothetical protein
MTERVRRSSRVQKQVPILLVGSDTDGRVFSEKTHTVVLSGHGAGIVSEYALSAEQELVLRQIETNREAEARVVGQLAALEGKYIYGIAFLDANLNFWCIDFAPLTDSEKSAARKVLECSSCKTTEKVEHSEVEADVFTINQGVIRYCKRCGSSTMWRLPPEKVEPDDLLENESEPPLVRSVIPAPIEQPAGAPPSVTLEPVTAEQAAPGPSSGPSAARQENRRKHVRTKVSFKACVRSESRADDIVTCEDISRGGLRFKSRKRYSENEMLEVAAPYASGHRTSSWRLALSLCKNSPSKTSFDAVLHIRQPRSTPDSSTVSLI